MSFSVGDKVTCSATHTYDGRTSLASFVRTNTYEVIQVGGKNLPDDRIVIGLNGVVTAAVKAAELTNISNPATPVEPDPLPEEDVWVPADPIPIDLDSVVSDVLSGFTPQTHRSFSSGSVNGSVVQTPTGQRPVSSASESTYSGYSRETIKTYQSDRMRDIERKAPSIYQNAYGFPKSKGFRTDVGYYRYDYYADYERSGLMSGLRVGGDDGIRKALNIDITNPHQLQKLYSEAYNKFKIANANDIISKTFAHVFFVRPDCNIFESSYMGNLAGTLNSFSEFYYAQQHNPSILRQLTQPEAGYNHQFLMTLSNKAESFEVSDEFIESDVYGEAITGYKIPYGKSNVKSRTDGKFSISYHETRNIDIYHLHRLWTNYISYVYRGKMYPKDKYILNKILDYATCVYYILTAEDGETVLFWTKYWGVFPLEAPSSQFSYSQGNAGGLTNPELKVEYQFAWKEDFNPLSLIEFNAHSINLPYRYVPTYQAAKVGVGYTWAGAPFIESRNSGTLDVPYTFKLRFREK